MKIILDACTYNLPANALAIPTYKNYLLNVLVNIGFSLDRAPIADILRKLHGLDGEWAIVSPVNWQATHNDSMLIAAGHDFSLNAQQSTFLFDKFSEFVRAEGMKLYMHDAVTWLIKISDKPFLKAKSVYSILHHSLMSELVDLDDSLYWQKFITMSQMLLSNLKLPDSKNLYPINGVWVWGGGFLQEKSSNELIALDEEALQIAKILSNNSHDYINKNSFSKNAIFLGSNIDSLQILKDKNTKKIKFWYWNNYAYKLQSKWNICEAIKCRFSKKN